MHGDGRVRDRAQHGRASGDGGDDFYLEGPGALAGKNGGAPSSLMRSAPCITLGIL